MRLRRLSVADVLIVIFMIGVIVVTLYPFLNIVAISLNDPIDTVRGGITIFPRVFTLENYARFFEPGSNLPAAFRMSVLRTVIGTFTALFCCAMFAFALSRKDFIFRKPFTIFLVITMYVSGGLIPEFLLIRNLGLIDNFLVYILPWLVNAFYVIVIRAYLGNIPFSLQESAKIDGANDLKIFFKVILPLCKPVLATMALFIAVAQWNSWFDTFLYARGDLRLSTLQFELMKILDNVQAMAGPVLHVLPDGGGLQAARRHPEAIRMAITVIATVPILVVYPFIQKYFVSGITLGAVKE